MPKLPGIMEFENLARTWCNEGIYHYRTETMMPVNRVEAVMACYLFFYDWCENSGLGMVFILYVLSVAL
jgi:hypothetical protein